MQNRNQILILLIIAFSATVKAQTLDTNYVKGSIYLKLKDTCKLQLVPYLYTNTEYNLVCFKYGVDVAKNRQPFPDKALSTTLAQTYQIRFKDTLKIDSLIYDLQKLGFIEYAEKEPKMKLHYTPNDFKSQQWHLSKINALQAWDINKGSSSIVIAIVDNGVRLTHSDLKANIWTNPGEIAGNSLDDDFNGYTDDINGYDVADNDNNPNPPPNTTDSGPFNHGTHCAGIASAATDNSNGISSIGFNAKIMAVKCTPNSATDQSLTNAYDGVYYAIRAKANIISMSFGAEQTSLTGQNLFTTAHNKGIILVASAGNDNKNTLFYPAAYNFVIAVGATDQNDKKASYSNFGSWVDVMAPGNSIYSTLAGSDNSYGNLGGTSMAAPLVAGLASLVKAKNPGFTPDQIEAALKKGCEKIDALNSGFEGQLGAGRINAYYAINPGAIEVPLVSLTSGLSIYPNPANDKLNLNLNNASQAQDIAIINSVGVKQEFKTLITAENQMQFDISNFPSGVYFVSYNSNNSQGFIRFIKL